MPVVILGTGIIGLSTAYYLSHLSESETSTSTSESNTSSTSTLPSSSSQAHKPREIHLVEPSPELFASASGKAAGFLAKDWFAPPVVSLGAFSFELHRRLAEEHGGKEKWGWSESVSYSMDRDESEEGDSEEDGADAQEAPPQDLTYENGASNSGSGSRSDSGLGSVSGGEINRGGGITTRHMTGTDLDWLTSGSSRTTVLQVGDADSAVADEPTMPNVNIEYPAWIRARPNALQAVSDKSTTGQVDPLRLCQFLLSECLSRGVKLHHPAKATKLVRADPDDPHSQTLIRLEFLNEEPGEENEQVEPEGDEQSPPGADPGVGVGGETATEVDFPNPPTESEATSATSLSDLLGSGERKEPLTGNSSEARGPSSLSVSLGSSSLSVRRSWPYSLGSGWTSTSNLQDPLSTPDYNTAASSSAGTGTRRRQARTMDVLCHSIIIAAGCWTPRVYRTLFPNAGRIPRIKSLAGHSIVMKSKYWQPLVPSRSRYEQASHRPTTAPVIPPPPIPAVVTLPTSESMSTEPLAAEGIEDFPTAIEGETRTPYDDMPTGENAAVATFAENDAVCHAIFTSDPSGFSPEIFSRAGGDIWLGGLNSSSISLPYLPTSSSSIISRTAIETLTSVGKKLCGEDVEIVGESLCFRPVTPTGRPVVSRVHEADLGDGVKVPGGVYVATGHGPWGISLGLGTGYVVSEMVLGRETSADVSGLLRWDALAL